MADASPDELADREWRLIREEVREGPIQMALDEVAAETAAVGGPRTLRVYRWDPSTLSLGYRQDPSTVDWAFCEREGIDVVRRPTGGGGIYHDRRGDVSYSIVAPADELPGDLLECYAVLCTPILEAFERLGMPVRYADRTRPSVHQPACYLRGLNPTHDLVGPDGRKVSGNAQHRTRKAVVQHGSLKFDVLPSRHLGTFTADLSPDAFTERVTCVREHVDVTRREMVETLERALQDWAQADPGGWSEAELDRARSLASERFGTDAWTRDRSASSA